MSQNSLQNLPIRQRDVHGNVPVMQGAADQGSGGRQGAGVRCGAGQRRCAAGTVKGDVVAGFEALGPRWGVWT